MKVRHRLTVEAFKKKVGYQDRWEIVPMCGNCHYYQLQEIDFEVITERCLLGRFAVKPRDICKCWKDRRT